MSGAIFAAMAEIGAEARRRPKAIIEADTQGLFNIRKLQDTKAGDLSIS
ncbi:hypothetical protein [Beijerinckia sp. L45]|nr:hypothetical protein [Beijerinckia sp. L45]